MPPTDHPTDASEDDATGTADDTDTADATDTTGAAAPEERPTDPLVVPLSLPAEDRTVHLDLGEFERVTRAHRFRCTSGDRFGGEWTGVPVETVLASVSLPGDTTHLVVAGADGFQVCVPVLAALDGLFAVEESGADSDRERRPDAPRFVSPGVDGPRTVQRVVRLEARRLGPGESADEFESM